MRNKLDGKFHGVIVKNKDGSVVHQDEWVVFLAKDNAFLPTLRFYAHECVRQGASDEQLYAVEALIKRVEEWRERFPEHCETPDVQAGELVL